MQPIEGSLHHPITVDNVDHWERDTLERLGAIAASVRRQAVDLRHHLEGIQYMQAQLEATHAMQNIWAAPGSRNIDQL